MRASLSFLLPVSSWNAAWLACYASACFALLLPALVARLCAATHPELLLFAASCHPGPVSLASTASFVCVACSYIQWLEKDLAEYPNDTRTLYYLGYAHFDIYNQARGADFAPAVSALARSMVCGMAADCALGACARVCIFLTAAPRMRDPASLLKPNSRQ